MYGTVKTLQDSSGPAEMTGPAQVHGKTITIRLKPEGDLTNLSIKVGLLGDKAKASVIYERIKQNLDMPRK